MKVFEIHQSEIQKDDDFHQINLSLKFVNGASKVKFEMLQFEYFPF